MLYPFRQDWKPQSSRAGVQFDEATDSLSIQEVAHALRVDFDFRYNNDTTTFPHTNPGSYIFSSHANFLGGAHSSSGYAAEKKVSPPTQVLDCVSVVMRGGGTC